MVPVSGPLPVFKPPDDFEPEWLVPADATVSPAEPIMCYKHG